MHIDSCEIQALKGKVCAADEEFSFAQACHEAWKPTAHDAGLHERVGISYAANTFNLIRLVLRREMVLALMRLWDKDKRTINLHSMGNALSDKRIVDALAADYAAFWAHLPPSNLDDVPEELRVEVTEAVRLSELEFSQRQGDKLREKASEAVSIIRKYQEGGSGYGTLDKLRDLRNERLAHRSVAQASPTGAAAAIPLDAEIESFYQDIAKLVRLLRFVVHQTDYQPDDSANIHAKYAAYFWASVRGERTEGHPSYRAPRHLSQQPPDERPVA